MREEINLDKEVLFFRYCNGTATSTEREHVEKMVAESSEIEEELEAVKEALILKNRIGEAESYDISFGYRNMQHKIKAKSKRVNLISVLSRIAAILVLPLLISTLVFAYMAFKGTEIIENVTYAEVTSAPGLVSCFELPDKSKVWLNSGASLRYPTTFIGAAREVQLKGEGYFEVESDKEHPFYVATKAGIKVMAHGTQFNVKATEKSIEAVLAEGKVDILLSDKILQALNTSEQAIFDIDTRKLSIREVNVYEKTAWKDGKIIFRNAPLDEVFDRLSERYNVDIVLHDHHKLSDRYHSRVTFTDETIQQIFTYLSVAAPIEWKLSSPIQNNDSTLTKQRIEVWLKKK